MKKFLLQIETASEGVIDLEYEVLDHKYAQKWYEIFSDVNVPNLRNEINIFSNFDISDNILQEHVKQLNGLIDQLNEFVEPKIVGKFDLTNAQESCNRLHVHFPETEKTEADPAKRYLLSQYNDCIHLLEGAAFARRYQDRGISTAKIILAFSRCGTKFCPIEEDEFQYFTIKRTFGDVVSHYPHVGRHYMEMFYAQDLDVPPDQVVPQHLNTAACTFHFGTSVFSNPNDEAKRLSDMKAFLRSYGEDRLPFAVDDPRAAIGYIPVAKMVNDFAADGEVAESYRRMLSNGKLLRIIHN